MMIRSTAVIVADFPDDSVEDEHCVLQFSGRGIAEALAEILRGLGYEVSTPKHQEENGWDFIVKRKHKAVWMQVAHVGDEFFLSTDYLPSLRAFFSQEQMYAPLLMQLNQALAADPRFKTVKWFDPRGGSEEDLAEQPIDD